MTLYYKVIGLSTGWAATFATQINQVTNKSIKVKGGGQAILDKRACAYPCACIMHISARLSTGLHIVTSCNPIRTIITGPIKKNLVKIL